MNLIPSAGIGQTMTSREIADLTGKNHADVMRDIRKMLDGLEVDQSSFADIFFDSYGRPQNCFKLPQDETICLMTGYDPKARMAVIKRWQELEARSIAPRELTRLEVLELALETEKRNIALTEQLAAAAPAVEFVGRYVDSTGSKGFRQVCKLLKAKEPAFRDFLRDKKIMYVLGREWVPFAEHIDAGRFEVKAGTAEVSGHAYNSARFTPKGVAWIAGLWAVHNLPKEE